VFAGQEELGRLLDGFEHEDGGDVLGPGGAVSGRTVGSELLPGGLEVEQGFHRGVCSAQHGSGLSPA